MMAARIRPRDALPEARSNPEANVHWSFPKELPMQA